MSRESCRRHDEVWLVVKSLCRPGAALTAGLVSATRTITLAWVVLGDKVLPLADLFLAASMIAKYAAPGLTKWLLTRILASGAATRTAAVSSQPARAMPAK